VDRNRRVRRRAYLKRMSMSCERRLMQHDGSPRMIAGSVAFQVQLLHRAIIRPTGIIRCRGHATTHQVLRLRGFEVRSKWCLIAFDQSKPRPRASFRQLPRIMERKASRFSVSLPAETWPLRKTARWPAACRHGAARLGYEVFGLL